ncbi:MAG: hypothetical protein Q7R95_06850 [bacterium]|nr:hypothetical protein [bacterium]
MKKILLIINGILIGLLAFYLITFKPVVSLHTNNFINSSNDTNKEYILTQKNNPYDYFSTRSLPTVSQKPGTDKYQLVLLKEYLNGLRTYDQLFFASKRIAELQTWGKELDWKITLNQYKNHVINYWKGIKKEDLQRKYPEFKATLQAHYRILEELIFFQYDDPVKNLQKIQYVDEIFNQFNQLIPNDTIISPKSLYYPLSDIVNDKEFGIYTITSQAQNNFNYIQNIQLLTKDFYHAPTISDAEDQESKLITFNNILINQTNSPSSTIKIKLPEIDNENITWTSYINKTSIKPYTYKSLIHSFYPGEFKISISYNFKNLESILLEEQVATTESKLKYRVDTIYQQTLYPHGYPHIFTDSFQKNEIKKNLLGTFLTIKSEKKLTPEELNSITINFTPIIILELTATKTANLPNNKQLVTSEKISDTQYKITTIGFTKEQDQSILNSLGFGWRTTSQSQNKNISEYNVIYWITYVIGFFTFCLFLVGIGVLFYTRERFLKVKESLLLFWKKCIIKPIHSLWKLFYFCCSSIREILLLIVLSGILVDIFVIKGGYDGIILLFTGLWTLVLIGYSVEARINFIFALIFLVFCPILLILKLDTIAEKSAVWTYMFLVVGTIQSIIEMKLEPVGLIEYSAFLKKIVGYAILQNLAFISVKILLNILDFTKKIFAFFVSFLNNRIIIIFKYFITLLKRIINTKPTSIQDHIMNILKISGIFSAFGFVIIFIVSLPIVLGYTTIKLTIVVNNYAIYYQKKLADEKLQKERSNLDPYIEKVEPAIVYPSTKIIVFGKGFSSRANDSQTNRVILRNEGEIITLDYWDDNKIIFTVPLHWKIGINHIWIDKPIIWNNKSDITKSNVVSLKLLPVSQIMTPDDDAFFEQLKKLTPEARKINGYE